MTDKRTITAGEYKGSFIFAQDIADENDGEGFFRTVEDLVQHCVEEEDELPAEVYGVITLPLRIDASRALDWEIENQVSDGRLADDARQDLTAAEVALLQGLLDAWGAHTGVRTIDVDENTIITIDAVTRADFEKRRRAWAGEPEDADNARLDEETAGAEEGGAS